MLCDTSIRSAVDAGQIVIKPDPLPVAYQPASVDLRLSRSIRPVLPGGAGEAVERESFTLQPASCVLGSTMEWVGVGAGLVARVEGKSTWGRRFLMVHATAGFIDPGFAGEITLELVNLGPGPLTLHAGEFIAQISFCRLDRPAARPYGSAGLRSHYQGQRGATGPRA